MLLNIIIESMDSESPKLVITIFVLEELGEKWLWI